VDKWTAYPLQTSSAKKTQMQRSAQEGIEKEDWHRFIARVEHQNCTAPGMELASPPKLFQFAKLCND